LKDTVNLAYNTTAFRYENGNLSAVTDATGSVTSFKYNAFGQLTTLIDARGEESRLDYDTQGNVTTAIDPLGGVTRTIYNGIGRAVQRINQNGHLTSLSYDANGQLTEVRDPLGNRTRFAYDGVGNLIKFQDAKEQRTRYSYDAANNMVEVINALGNSTSYAYDPNNNLIGLTDANGHVSTSIFDALNRRVAMRDPLGNETRFTYDAMANIVAITEPTESTRRFSYNNNNQTVKVVYADGSSVSYIYDANGNRISMAEQRGQTNYTYNALDQLMQVAHPDGSVVSYDYDAVGNRTRITYPDGKASLSYYDALGRLSEVRDRHGQPTLYGYDAAGNLLQTTYPNSTIISYRYDSAERLSNVINTLRHENRSNSVVLAEFAYTLDELGNPIRSIENHTSGKALEISYTYDALSQLTAVQLTGPTGDRKHTEFSYDAVGNRLTQTTWLSGGNLANAGPWRTQYIYNAADQLLLAGAATYAYDVSGNRLTQTDPEKGNRFYTYDTINRLVKVRRPGVEVIYTYDADGNKVEETVNEGGRAETIRFLNDVAVGLPVVLQEERVMRDRVAKTTRYEHGLALISEELSGPRDHPQQFFYHTDRLGSTIALCDHAGRTQAEYKYDAWGNVVSGRTDVPNRFLFTAEEQDPETGLYYLRARWYDPKIGRFLTKDLFGGIAPLPESVNRYVYALGNPNDRIDPTGTFSFKKFLKKAARLVAPVNPSWAYTLWAIAAPRDVATFTAKVAVTAAVCANTSTACSAGLALGLLDWVFHPELSNIRLGWGYIVFTHSTLGLNQNGGVTLGNVIIYPLGIVAERHEWNHVLQSIFLGNNYLPAHIGFDFFCSLIGHDYRKCNPLENQAYQHPLPGPPQPLSIISGK
jgi:RHS repeat-associated protein